jgi:hypothetical protein
MGIVTARRRAPALLLAAALALGLTACGSDDEDGSGGGGYGYGAAPPVTTAPPASESSPAPTTASAPAPQPPPEPTALAGLPAFTAGFQSWDRLNAEPIPPDSAQTRRVGFDAHRGTKDVYVSVPKSRLTRGGTYPDGTILVKAARTDDEITLAAIMRKVQGVDPAHGDWEFVEYKRSSPGAAFATDASLTGATCWSCHATAMDTDWVFTPLDS